MWFLYCADCSLMNSGCSIPDGYSVFFAELYLMTISMIAAMARNRVIGKDNKIPWSLPFDMKYFKEVTRGHVMVSGRKNFESMRGDLDHGRIIVLTRDTGFSCNDCEVFHSVEDLLPVLHGIDDEIFIIGGAEIYRIFLPLAGKIYITTIDSDFEGDTFFPELDQQEWVQVFEKKGLKNAENPYEYVFRAFERNQIA